MDFFLSSNKIQRRFHNISSKFLRIQNGISIIRRKTLPKFHKNTLFLISKSYTKNKSKNPKSSLSIQGRKDKRTTTI